MRESTPVQFIIENAPGTSQFRIIATLGTLDTIGRIGARTYDSRIEAFQALCGGVSAAIDAYPDWPLSNDRLPR